MRVSLSVFNRDRNPISYSRKVLRGISAICSLFGVTGQEMEGWEVEEQRKEIRRRKLGSGLLLYENIRKTLNI